MKRKFIDLFILFLIIVFWLITPSFSLSQVQEQQEEQIEKAKIYRDVYPLISEKDLYCSFFVLEEKPALEIIGAEREYERSLFNVSDIIYLNQGEKDGLRAGEMFSIIEIGPKVKNFGRLAFRRGRVRVIFLEEKKASAKIEKLCGQVGIGDFLVPFKKREEVIGKGLGYDVPPQETEGIKGEIVYTQDSFTQIGKNHWALIDIGETDGVKVGKQLIIYREVKEGAPVNILGNCVVIDVQAHTSTIKILSTENIIRLGDLVQPHPQ